MVADLLFRRPAFALHSSDSLVKVRRLTPFMGQFYEPQPVCNRSIEEQRVHLTFGMDALGLDSRDVEVRDTMYNRTLPMEADGGVSLDLDSERWTYL